MIETCVLNDGEHFSGGGVLSERRIGSHFTSLVAEGHFYSGLWRQRVGGKEWVPAMDGIELCFSKASVLSPIQPLSSPSVWILETFDPEKLNIMLCMGVCFQVIKQNSTSILHKESRICQQSLAKIFILSHENLVQTMTPEKCPLG